MRPLFVVIRCQLDAPASVLFRMAGHMSGSTGRAPRLSLPDGGGAGRDQLDAPASVPSGAGAYVQGVRCVRHGMGGKVLPGEGTR